jgi:hypothetical protein
VRRITLTVLCLGLLGYPVAGTQAQSLYGPGGLFLHPSANVAEEGQLTAGILVLSQKVPTDLAKHATPTWASFSLDYGLTKDIEIAATSLLVTDFKPSYGGSFKYRFLHESRSQPAAAAGFTYSGFGGSDTRAGFVALRKELNPGQRHPIVGHVGVLYIHMLAGLTYNQFEPYAGVEWSLAPRLTLIAEARPRGKMDFKTSSAFSLAYHYGRSSQLVITYVNTGQSTQSRFGVGVGFPIGAKR